MRRHVTGTLGETAQPPLRLRHLPPLLREQPTLLHDPVLCRIHGSTANGLRPYITFTHVRYTSDELTRSARLNGQRLRVHADPSDLRQLIAVTEDGQILQPLLASSIWRFEAHSMWLRREVFKAKRAKELNVDEGQNPIDAFVEQRRRKAGKLKRSASDIARAQRDRQQSGAAPTPAADPPVSPVLSQLATGPVKAKRLRIPPGFAR